MTLSLNHHQNRYTYSHHRSACFPKIARSEVTNCGHRATCPISQILIRFQFFFEFCFTNVTRPGFAIVTKFSPQGNHVVGHIVE